MKVRLSCYFLILLSTYEWLGLHRKAAPYLVHERPVARSESGFGSKSVTTATLRSPISPTAEVPSSPFISTENSRQFPLRSPLSPTEASGSGINRLFAPSEVETLPPGYSA